MFFDPFQLHQLTLEADQAFNLNLSTVLLIYIKCVFKDTPSTPLVADGRTLLRSNQNLFRASPINYHDIISCVQKIYQMFKIND